MEYVGLTWVDYSLFTTMFGLSAIVGVYFGFFQKQDTPTDYVLGGRTMKVFPAAMSLVASTLSSVAFLGIPTEIYLYGTQYWTIILSIFCTGFAMRYIFLPVYTKLQVISIFEYLEIRFDKRLRIFASAMNTVSLCAIVPVFIYASSMAFNQVTGLNIYSIAIIMSVICIFYTTIGGIKAVIWADTIQFCITLCTMTVILIIGTISVGGFSVVWERAELGDRLEFFNMNPDPTLRNSFWTVFLGNFVMWTSFMGTGQGTTQRLMAVPTYNDSKKILVIYIIFTITTKLMSGFTGLILYAKYFDCDPLTRGCITKPDQILPYFVVNTTKQLPGLCGLFLAGLFGAALSTLSTIINCLAATIYQDFVSPFLPNSSKKKASTIMKLVSLLVGIISICLIYVVEKLGPVLQMLATLSSIREGPILGIFLLGLLFPKANAKGALWGGIISVTVMLLMNLQVSFMTLTGSMKLNPKPFYTYGCNGSSFDNGTTYFNQTTNINTEDNQPFWIFRISFYYYALIGITITITVGLFVSWITQKPNDPPINRDYLSPFIHRFVSETTCATKTDTVGKEMQIFGDTVTETLLKIQRE